MEEHFEAIYPDTAHTREIEKIIGYTKDGSSCQLISIPGGGRSIVLGLLANSKRIRLKHLGPASPAGGNTHTDTHFVLVSFLEIRKRPLIDVMKFLFLGLSDSLRARKPEEYKKINDLFTASMRFRDELILLQGLKEAIDYLCLERKLKIVFLFDRFEEYIPTVTSEFFTTLRTLRARAKYQFSVVFSVTRPLEEVLDPATFTDFYEFTAGHNIYLKLYDPATTEARVGHIEKIAAKKLSPALLTKIIKETGGVGRLIKLSVEAVLANASEEKNLSEFLYSQRTIQAALSEICSALSPSEQSALILGKFDDKAVVDYLEHVGIVRRGKIQIPLFERHIETHFDKFRDKAERIIYDENTNSIQKADVVLSDQLTSSEFRLLRFLLQTPDKVIERDEIIEIVWPDVKSTAGITDQAVDQLVFRLRRKIEDDPNKPAHMITVKGRGFKFLP